MREREKNDRQPNFVLYIALYDIIIFPSFTYLRIVINKLN